MAAVPSDFIYEIQHSETTGRQNNAFFAFNYLESRFTIADNEGINGLPFVTLDDPRAPVFRAGDVFGDNYEFGFDGSTPLYLHDEVPRLQVADAAGDRRGGSADRGRGRAARRRRRDLPRRS